MGLVQRKTVKETLVVFTPENLEKSLDGRKSQTRRVMRPQPSDEWWPYGNVVAIHGHNRDGELDPDVVKGYGFCNEEGDEGRVSPYGRAGDILLQAEPYQYERFNPILNTVNGRYLRDNAEFEIESERLVQMIQQRKRPFTPTSARFMPKELARVKYILTAVRVERVQDISEEDAIAEGCEAIVKRTAQHLSRSYTATSRFAILWNLINAKRDYGWEANPWVWVYEYALVTTEFDCTDCDGRWYYTNGRESWATLHVGDGNACIPF